MLAVIQTGGKQYLVKEGDTIEVEKINSSKKSFIFDKVLLVVDEEKKKFLTGKPYIKQAKVEAEILETKKGKKVFVERYKRKTRYHKKTGHRQWMTKVIIKKISSS